MASPTSPLVPNERLLNVQESSRSQGAQGVFIRKDKPGQIRWTYKPSRTYLECEVSLELVIHDNNVMCKILFTTFRGNVKIWCNNLKSGSILSFQDLCAKLVACFGTSIPMKKSSTKLFGII